MAHWYGPPQLVQATGDPVADVADVAADPVPLSGRVDPPTGAVVVVGDLVVGAAVGPSSPEQAASRATASRIAEAARPTGASEPTGDGGHAVEQGTGPRAPGRGQPAPARLVGLAPAVVAAVGDAVVVVDTTTGQVARASASGSVAASAATSVPAAASATRASAPAARR